MDASAPLLELDPLREPLSSGALQQALDRLDSVGTVLYVAAHPDDENTRLLAWLAGARGLRSVYVSLTRGDGGQNLIGQELGPLLGLIRTHELLAARRIDGAEQRFTRAVDFGYSKSADETLRLWGKDAILGDLVRVIREVRPDLIITRFSPEPPNHGHHMASAILAREAFDAAADPARFPEQLTPKTGLTPWATPRLLENKSPWRFKEGEDLSRYLSLDVGTYSPLLGRSYAELAAASRTMHKSQGFGSAPAYGPQLEYFEETATRVAPSKDPLATVTSAWSRFPGTAPLQAALTTLRTTFSPAQPERSLPAALAVRKALLALPSDPTQPVATYRLQKLAELDRLLLSLAGLYLDVRAPSPTAIAGEPLAVTATLLARQAPATLTSITWPDGQTDTTSAPLPSRPGTLVKREAKLRLPASTPWSTPRWLRKPRTVDHALFDLESAVAIHPVGPPDLAASITLDLGSDPSARLTVSVPLRYGWVDPVHGERFRPVEVLPPLTVTPRAPIAMFPLSASPRTVTIEATVTAHGGAREALIALEPPSAETSWPAAWKVSAPQKVTLKEDGAEATVSFTVTLPATPRTSPPPFASAVLGLRATLGTTPIETLARRVIEPSHIPTTTLLSPATVRAIPLRLDLGTNTRTPKGHPPRIGYIAGAGDEVAQSLAAVGYEIVNLDPATLDRQDLSSLTAIVAGIRSYNVTPALEHQHAALMRYVEGGGTYLVQYLTSNRQRPLGDVAIGPFPFTVDQGRVTDETATMTLLDPKHPAVTTPNPLDKDDFAGWVQERGLYFASTWDKGLTPIFEANDPGEKPLQGAVLVARHGKGAFVYTGLSFFRQLPEGVPGAYRLFANLLALGAAR
ncbi:MAG: PIG-L family deacetylase [Deltaproteobacteria bacterium]|nr:PIG-L family deacetylase [Deltaproteobacteria bacterium]